MTSSWRCLTRRTGRCLAIADFAGATVAYVSRMVGMDQERVLFAFFDLLVGAAQKAKAECGEEKGS